MITRRHIRLKVMQSLYSYFSNKKNSSKELEKQLLESINETTKLHLSLLSFLIGLAQYFEVFITDSKKRYFPSESKLDADRSFLENRIVAQIFSDKILMKNINLNSEEYLNNIDADFYIDIFSKLFKSDLYIDYVNNPEKSFNDDKYFIISVLDKHIINNQKIQHLLYERSMYWRDDLPFISSFLVSQINSLKKERKKILSFKSGFKNKEDKLFALELYRKTIKLTDNFESIIIEKAKNWELDRIAIMDQILLKMSFTEIFEMQELPIKVSMNEYIEISKYYSTKKSSIFINGILDSVVRDFNKKGKIKKSGKGLV